MPSPQCPCMDLVCEECTRYCCKSFAEYCDTPRNRSRRRFMPPDLRTFLQELIQEEGGTEAWTPVRGEAESKTERLRTVYIGNELEPKEKRAESIHWNESAHGLPNDKELLLYALIVVSTRTSMTEINDWVGQVRRHTADFVSRGIDGLPADWKPYGSKVPSIYEPLARVFDKGFEWKASMLNSVCSAMSAWDGPGQQTSLNARHLSNYKARVPIAKAKGPPRWKTPEALFGVANLIYHSRLEMQRLLAMNVEHPKPTIMEALAFQKAMQVDLHEMELDMHRAKDAKRKAAERLTQEKTKSKQQKAEAAAANKLLQDRVSAAIKRHKQEVKLKFNERKAALRAELKPALREAARNEIRGELSREKNLRNKAHMCKRDALAKVTESQLQSEKRLRRAQLAEEKLREARDELAELSQLCHAASEKKRTFEEMSQRLESMPTWQPVQKGRGRKQFDFNYRIAIYQQYANGTPRSAIGPNIVSIVRRSAPWLNPVPPSPRMLIDARFELRTIEEALSARSAAQAYRIRMFGSDESCKYGNAAITSSVIIEPKPGAELQVVVLRGVYCSGGSTAAAVSQAIEAKCFERLRDLLRRWKGMFFKMFPDETWTGPEASQLSLARLAGGGALMGDTCNTMQLTKALLTDMIAEQARSLIGQEAWAQMSEGERAHATRVHKLDCWQHLRNIFLKHMSKKQASHVAEQLKPWLDTFSSWERMSTDFTQLLRASYKELHHGNAYYKGKGREFWVWLRENYPKRFTIHFERAEGGRQDLDYDAAIPLYIMRPYVVEFLHTLVFGANHSNILEDFLYLSFSSAEYIAMTRANAIVDLVVSRPLRWLSGNSYKLDNWSPLDMRVALGLVHDVFVKAKDDGSVLLDPSLDIFKPIADTQPLFAEWREYTFTEEHIFSADGTTPHLLYQLTRKELFNPEDATNAAANVRLKTIEYLEVQCAAGLEKMTDPKVALKQNLPAEGVDVLARADTIGLDATNDRLSESVFGQWDYILRRNPGITLEAANALVQSISRGKSFEDGGAFTMLPENEGRALVEMARQTVKEMRSIDRSDHAELDAYHTAKRKSNSQQELDAVVKMYALALSFFDRWRQRGIKSVAQARVALAHMDRTQLKLDYLREQIEMRVIGMGFDEFNPAWSSNKSDDIGTVDDLLGLLNDILMEESERRRTGNLPSAAVVPQMRRKTYKELGTPTVQATALATKVLNVSEAELLKQAIDERKRLVDAGEVDDVGDNQPSIPPKCDASLVGTMLEIRWRYWEKVTNPKDKRMKKAVDIWCEGEVVQVANGTTDTAGPTCKKLLKAGAVRIKWPADLEREEEESYTWSILTEANWNAEAVLGWRFSASELRKREAKRKRPRLNRGSSGDDQCVSDNVQLTDIPE